MCEAINKLASSATKRTLQRLASSYPPKVPHLEAVITTPQTVQRNASEPSSVVTIKVHIPPILPHIKQKGWLLRSLRRKCWKLVVSYQGLHHS